MEDSFSEASERSRSHNSNNSDQQSKDAQMIAESKGAQLAEQNAILTKENTQLKAQIDQTVSIEPQLEKFLEKNKQLASENRRIKDEKDDLDKRYAILQKTNADLEKQVEEEKKRCRDTQKQCIETSKKEIKKAKSQAKSQIDEFCKQIDALQAKSDKDDIELKTFNSKIERLLENATRYFGQEFQDTDSLISYLSGSFPPQQTISASQSNVISTPGQIRTAPSTPSIHPTPSITKQSSNFSVNQATPGTVTQLEKKLKREKTKTKTLTNDKDELELSISRLKREINELNNKHQEEISKIHKEAQKASEEQKLTDANTQHTIQTLENKVEVLTKKNEELKQKVKEAEIAYGIPQPQFPDQTQTQLNASSSQSLFQFQSEQSPSPFISTQKSQPIFDSPIQHPLFSPASQNGRQQITKQMSSPISRQASNVSFLTPQRSQVHEGNDQIHNCPSSEHIVNQNIDLNERLKGSKNRCDELTDKLKKAEAQRNELKTLLDKEKGENNSLKIVHSNTVKELDMMREALHCKESVKDRNDKKLMRREFNEQKAKLEGVTQQLESLKKQLNDSITAHQQDLTNIKNLNREIDDLKEEKALLIKERDNAKEEIINLQAEFESYKRNEITPEKVIPIECWQSEKLPNEINSSIAKVSGNSSLEPKTKLKTIYSIIAKKYGEMIKSRDNLLEESYNETQSIRDVLKDFLSDLTIALELKPITFDEFINDQPQQEIINAIKNLRNCHEEMRRSNQQLTQTLARVHQTFGSAGLDGADEGFDGQNSAFPNLEEVTSRMEREVATVKSQLCITNDQLQKKNKKCKELGAALKTLKRKTDSDAEDAKIEIERLRKLTDSLKVENDEYSKLNQKLKWDIQRLTTEFEDYKQMHDEESKELDEKFESQTKLALVEKQRIEQNYQEQIRLITEQYNDTSGYLAENQEQLEKLKQELETQKAILAEKERVIERLRDENDEYHQGHFISQSNENTSLINNFERAVEEQKLQCEGHRADVEKVAKQLAATEKQLKHYKEKVIQLKKEKAQMEVDLKNKIDQLERQKKLIETNSKIELMNAQSSFNAKIEEEEKKFEDEKRKIYSTIADTFRQFLSVGSSLNEKSFKSTIYKARDELARLTSLDNSVRRLVNAEINQKTDDAVAQIVITQNK